MTEETQNTSKNETKFATFGMCLFISILLIAVGHLYLTCTAQQKTMQTLFNESRKIYVYSLEDVLLKVEVLEDKKKFEQEVVKLNEELIDTEAKIKNIKNAKLKEDFSDVYIKNLRMKRDELINNYQKTIDELTKKVNGALIEIAKEKDVPTIFLKSSIAINTPHVIDLTNEIAERVKNPSK